MSFKQFIPEILLKFYRKWRIKKLFGEKNRIETVLVHPTAKLGKEIYIANNVDIRANVSIDDYSYCSPNTIVFSGVKIGKYCSIGYSCQIGLPEHPTNFISTSPHIYRNRELSEYMKWPIDDFIEPPIIGNDVWIGSNVLILQGVHIGNGAVIAAGSVVTKDVMPFSIVGGVPAKLIRYRFEKEICNRLDDSQWWLHDIKWIKEHYSGLIQ